MWWLQLGQQVCGITALAALAGGFLIFFEDPGLPSGGMSGIMLGLFIYALFVGIGASTFSDKIKAAEKAEKDAGRN